MFPLGYTKSLLCKIAVSAPVYRDAGVVKAVPPLFVAGHEIGLALRVGQLAAVRAGNLV